LPNLVLEKRRVVHVNVRHWDLLYEAGEQSCRVRCWYGLNMR